MILNLFGTSFRVWRCDFEEKLFHKFEFILQKHQLHVTELFTNMDFIQELGYQHWSELASEKPRMYFEISTKNSMEIKRKGHKILKFKSTDLLAENLLFKLYDTSFKIEQNLILSGKKSILIIQKEIGLAAKYDSKEEIMSLDDLCFDLVENSLISSSLLLKNIKIKNKNAKIKKDDTLVREVFVCKIE
jgi:hypothetical protein